MARSAPLRRLVSSLLALALAASGAGTLAVTRAVAAAPPPPLGPSQTITAARGGPGATSPDTATVTPRLRPHVSPANPGPAARPPEAATPAQGPRVNVSASGQGLGAGNFSPSDSTGAIGLTHYIEAVNTQVGMYDRNLAQLSAVDLGVFIGLDPGSFPTDPQIQWDNQGGRWLYAALEVSRTLGGSNRLDFGWSKSGDPATLSASDWCTFHLPAAVNVQDFPKLGHDANFLLIGTNVFASNSPAAGFQTSAVWAIAKPGAADSSCTAPAVSEFGTAASPLRVPGSAHPLFTPVPSNVADASATSYIVASDIFSTNSVGVLHVSPNAGDCMGTTTPCLVPDGAVPVNPWAAPAAGLWTVKQPGTSATLDAGDDRLTQAVQVDDPMVAGEAVWTQHTAGVSSAPDARTYVSWYELIPGLCSKGVCQAGARRQEGVVSRPDMSIFNAAISPDSQGQNAVINYDFGGPTLVFIGARGRTATDALGAMLNPVVVAGSGTTDTDFSCTPQFGGPPCRWGDYPGASPDPVATDTVWGSNMLAGNVASMGGAPTWTTRNFAIRPWESLGGQLAPGTGPAASTWGTFRMDLFVHGPSDDLQHSFWNGTGWSAFASLGGVLKDSPGAASGAVNRVDAFVRGQDDALWHIFSTDGGATWSAWQGLGGGLVAGPEAAAWAPSRLDVFVSGTDRQLWHRYSNDAGATWSGWEPLGGALKSGPGVASWDQGRLDIFVRGWDNALWHMAWDGARWTPWQSLGGVLTSRPAAASCGPNTLEVVVLGQDNAVWRQSWNGFTWSGWQFVGGSWTGEPGSTCIRTTQSLDIFTRGGTDSAVWHTATNAFNAGA